MRTRFGTVPDNAGDLPDRSHQGAFDDLLFHHKVESREGPHLTSPEDPRNRVGVAHLHGAESQVCCYGLHRARLSRTINPLELKRFKGSNSTQNFFA